MVQLPWKLKYSLCLIKVYDKQYTYTHAVGFKSQFKHLHQWLPLVHTAKTVVCGLDKYTTLMVWL